MLPTNAKPLPAHLRAFNSSTAIFLLAAASFLYSFLFIFPFLPIGGNGDALYYLAPGQRMYQGELIYRDVFEFVPPGTALANFLMFKVFGLRLWIPHLLALLLGVGLVWLGVSISRKMMRPHIALLPSGIFLVGVRGFLCDATHHWYSLLTAVAAIAVLLERRTTARIVAAGLFCGLSACFTQTRGLAAVAGFAVYLWWESRQKKEGGRALIRKETWLLISFFAALLAVNGYFILESGPARFFWCTVVYVVKYYPKASDLNSFSALKTFFPAFTSLHTFLPSFVDWLFLFALTPIIYILFFVRYWRASCKFAFEYWERPMLVAIVGLFMLLSIAPAPDNVRMATSLLPPLILLIWLLDSTHKSSPAIVTMLTLSIAIVALHAVTKNRPVPAGTLTTSRGAFALVDPVSYQEYSWIQQHTHPSQYFYEAAWSDIYFYLDLRNPTPLPLVLPSGYTPQMQVAEVIQGLQRHQVKYILWAPSDLDKLPSWENPSDDHLGPLRDFIHNDYVRVHVFSNSDEIWQRKND